MTCTFLSPRVGRPRLVALALSVSTAALALAPAAIGQGRGHFSSDPNVTVDLSVLGGSGGETVDVRPLPQVGRAQPSASRPAAADTAYGRTYDPSGLLFPPPDPPRSRLVGDYADLPVPQLRRPEPPAAPSAASPASPAAPQSRLTRPALSPPALTPPDTRVREPDMAKPGVPESTMSKPVGAAPPPPDPAPQPGASAARTSPVRVPPPPTLPEPQAAPAPPVAPPAATAQPERIAPPPASDKSTQPAAVETAARAPEAAPTAPAGPGDLVRVLFDAGSAKLPADSRDSLQTLAVKLQDDENLRLQIEAYAQGTSDTASQARRLSLSRALAVRAYLIEKGVRSTRMDVRALGTKPSDPPAPSDRVDARLVER